MRGFRELDRILRGTATVAPGTEVAEFAIPIVPLLVVNVALAALYGVCMGFFGVFGRAEQDFRFILADAIKVPLLLLLTLVVTFPSLCVFNALVGSRLYVRDLVRLLTATMGVLVAVLAAFGPIVAFFSVTTTSYPFIVLLNVGVFTLAAGFAITFLLRTVDRLSTPRPPAIGASLAPPADVEREAMLPPADTSASEEPSVAPGETDYEERRARRERYERRPREEPITPPPPGPDPKVRAVYRGWLVVFALVGAQMSWVLRPFIGTPDREFAWFRPRDGSFFEGVAKSLRLLFGS